MVRQLACNRHKDTLLEFVSDPDPVDPKMDQDPGILLNSDPELDPSFFDIILTNLKDKN
jgi:hypothetical protein